MTEWPVESLTYWGWPWTAGHLWSFLGWRSDDPSVVLMQQLIAVDLNIAAGAQRHEIHEARDAAEQLLWETNVGFNPQGPVRDELMALAGELRAWNGGDYGPGACESDEGL